jgi:cytidine deaminase
MLIPTPYDAFDLSASINAKNANLPKKDLLLPYSVKLNLETFGTLLRINALMIEQFTFSYHSIPSIQDLTEQDQALVRAAHAALSRAYAPYSKFKVGASILLQSGLVIEGNNQENIAYPSGLCAERVALFYAGANHPNDPILKICIAAEGDLMPKEALLSPCGSCRQVMLESEARQASEIEVLLVQRSGEVLVLPSVQNLLPFGFTK